MKDFLNILYVHGVGPWGGSSRSLFETISNFPVNSVNPFFISVKGSSQKEFDKLTSKIIDVVGLSRFDNTQYSYYKGIRWLVLVREIFFIPYTIFAFIQAKRKFKNIDIIHINDVVEIFPLLLSKLFFNVPIVVHVRSVCRLDFTSFRSRLITSILNNYADAIICIDKTVRSSLNPILKSYVVNNSFSNKFITENDYDFLEEKSKMQSSSFKIGFVGSLMKSKGIFELLDAFKIIKERNFDATLVYVGGEPENGYKFVNWFAKKLGLRQFMLSELNSKIIEYKLEDSVFLLGHTNNIKSAYQLMDIVCIPGYFNAPGRQLIEAAFNKIPVILSITNPKDDTLIPYETGIPIPLKDHKKLAKAIVYCIQNRDKVKEMGIKAFELANKNFNPKSNSIKILNIYKKILKLNDV